MKVIVLGAGLVGRPMALDLAGDRDMQVTVVDISADNLSRFAGINGIETIQKDLSKSSEIGQMVQPFDMVLNAVPGFMGFQTLKAVIEAGKNVVDITFFPEDMFDLDELAKKHRVTAVSDMGVAPGMSNLLVGYADHQLDKTEKVLIYVGGLPKVRQWPYEYKAVFSPADVIEEYTRPARYVRDGGEIVKPALSEPELIDFDGIGTLEAFNSDGLRSIARTIKGGFMIEKTLRYPGHIELMKVFRESGFFSRDIIEVSGTRIKPLDFTSKLLFEQWKLNEGDEDLTVMKVIVEGVRGNERITHTWDLFDTYDRKTGIHSMARTTGYAATMVLRMIKAGIFTQKGIIAPELIGRDERCVDYIIRGLEAKGVVYRKKMSTMTL
jgi:lysine 6-dehydrogenase